MEESQLYQENLARFLQANPDAGTALENADTSQYQFCKTDLGEENLVLVKGKDHHYFHAQSGALQEAKKWADDYIPFHLNTLVVYGIGLGYIYEALDLWFQTNPGRLLVILEDDLALIKQFLKTEHAARLLSDRRVIYQYFKMPGTQEWGRFREKFEWIFSSSIVTDSAALASDAYLKWRPHEAQLITRQFTLYFEDFHQLRQEYLMYRDMLARNYYENFHLLQECHLMSSMEGKFQGIPALICGAGPSLDTILESLLSLKDRALIYGSGTAMNILTRCGFRPHFGIAIDPQPVQESRYLSSFSYEIPFLYVPRFNYKGAQWFQNPLIYVDIHSGSYLYSWISKMMSFSTKTSYLGRSSSTVATALSSYLGSNPIVLTGMNLAYHEGERYAAGSGFYPATDLGKQTPRLAGQDFPTTGPQGEEMETNWIWIVESSYYSNFVELNPDKSLINASEGGMKILNVPSLKFSDCVSKHFVKSYDLDGWVHAEIALARNLKDESKQLADLFAQWKESLQHCLDHFSQPVGYIDADQWMEMIRKAGKDPEHNVDYESDKAIAEEPFYLHYLKMFGIIKFYQANLELKRIESHRDLYSDEEIQQIVDNQEEGRWQLSKSLCEEALVFYSSAWDKMLDQENQTTPSPTTLPQPSKDECYSYENGLLIIKDPEFELDYTEEWKHDDRFELRFDSGNLKGEMLYKKGLLHGPSTFYSESGAILSRTWFVDGKREGKVWQYDAKGNLTSLQRYKKGVHEGRQGYFYPDGSRRTILEFHNGLLNGTVSQFYSNGKPKRTQHFINGKLNGLEQVWDETGVLAIEVTYRDNQPIGTMRTWHPNGKLAKEVVIHSNSRDFDLTMWNEEGIVVQKQISLPENPLEAVIKQSAELENTLSQLADKLNALIELKRQKLANEEKSHE